LSYYFGFSFVQIYTSKGQDIEELIQKVSESNLNVKYYALIIKELKRLLKATFNENLNEFLCAKNKRLRNRQGVQEIFHKYLDLFSYFLQIYKSYLLMQFFIIIFTSNEQ
jgi:hypothetical protein